LSNTVIFADLNVKDYSANGGVGTIAGYANSNCGDVIFLNCHTDGIVSNIDGGFHGGLMGSTNMSATLMSYKCSTKIRGTAYSAGTSWSSGIGGVVGYMGNGGKLKVYDFYGDNEANVIVTSGGSYSGLVAGCITISSIDLDGIIGRHYVKTTGTQNYYFDGGVATIYVPNSMSFGDWSVKNTYITAQHDFSNGTASFIPYFIGAPTASYSNFRGNQITSNVHYASDAQSVYTHNTGKEVFTSSLGLAHETYGTSGLWDAAKNDNNFNEKIWDKDKIGTQDILNESPVKNNAITIQDFKIQYRNLKIVDGEAVLEKLTGVEDITYNLGESVTHPIPTTAAVDHKFAGWTLYKDTEVFADSSTPTDLYGDVIFYAVWDVENAVGNVTADKTTIEYSTGYLTLTANISVKNIAEPNIVYKWYHNGTEVKGAVSKNLMIDEVNESGSYSLEYTIRDKIEPLWRVTAKTDSIDVEITKGELSIKKFAISESTIPYTGKPIPEIEFSATIINSAGDEVEGTVSWQYNTGNVAEGINTRNINFRP
ncbi:MAG: hypothetical protein K2L47_02625, partial [Clostridia bacterium]|nr:hypothetical protein [Clostridia bacterium]